MSQNNPTNNPQSSQQKIYLKDYTPPTYTVESVDLDIKIFENNATVDSTLTMTKVYEGDLVLLGRQLDLVSISINDRVLNEQEYSLDKEQLVVSQEILKNAIKDTITVKTQVIIYPQKNTALEGLYLAGSGDDIMYVTQCEAEGFRKITFYPDRPDVLSVYTTRVEASKKFPTLLANGNLVEAGDCGDDRHFAIWHDPTKKPSYLFACVVADLAVLSDNYTTSEGRDVLLEIYAKPQDIDKCHISMQALKDSMKWDEENYGCAYDLDRYMIVATSQFNMGAMENKGLNIFNTACVLSSPDTATDARNFSVKSIIAHEYFHNWTGNRVTCRDWFQLCLKEGLTVYRDQSFSADFRSAAVQRIDDVSMLKATQFTEDASTLAHPPRPDNFVEINNFYTATVYEKGAEIVRMMANLLGKEKYRRGMDIYFERHDGQAATVEDFVAALATQDERINDFMQWYKQPATPVLKGQSRVESDKVIINLSQSIRHVAGYDKPKLLPIPVAVAVFDNDTGELLGEELLILTDAKKDFTLNANITNKTPLVSVLRGFSAPVILEFEYSDEELAKLAQFETDGFNRWQAIQMLVTRYLTNKSDDSRLIADALRHATDALLTTDPMLASRLFDVAGEKELAATIDDNYNPQAVKNRRDKLKQELANALSDKSADWYHALAIAPYEDTPMAAGVRALRNVVLELIAKNNPKNATPLAHNQYNNANCMSERLGALMVMVHYDLADKDAYLDKFYHTYKDEDLVIDSWFMIQAAADSADADVIKALMTHDDFDWQTPNRVRTVLGALANRPTLLWSNAGLDIYLSALTKLDALNPQLSARLLGGVSRWYTLADKAYVNEALIAFKDNVQSKNVLEVAERILSV